MEVSDKDIENLKRLQDIDVAATNAKRELEGLPQRKQLADIRAKLEAIREKQQEIDKLAESNRTELSRVGAEIEILSIRQEETQKKIDEAGTDFRAIESLSKDMASMTARTGELEKNRETIHERDNQIAKVKRQIEAAIDALAQQEASVSEVLNGKIGVLEDQLSKEEDEHKQLIAALPDQVAAEYERARRHCGGVALSELVDGQCSTCRSKLEETRLLQVRRQAPLSVCPMCHRLLIVR
ncbi:MAG: zinc ribbon domain-containing protein [Eggerthellaceae bacterium]|jgi:predicted  nucleic acid-binding Zn-ribbon protein